MILATSLIGCNQADVGGIEPKDDPDRDDIADALSALPDAQIIEFTDDGRPAFIIGALSTVHSLRAQTDDPTEAHATLMAGMPQVLAPFRLSTDQLALQRINTDDNGNRHFRYRQVRDGLDVVGGDIVVHVDVKGVVSGINGYGRGDFDTTPSLRAISQDTAVNNIRSDARWAAASVTAMRQVYLRTRDGQVRRAYEGVAEGTLSDGAPQRDKVFVDVDTGEILAVHPQIYFAENRRVHSGNGGTALPGTLRRSEGQGPTGDLDIDGAYAGTGHAYEGYKAFFNRDSFDNAGAALISTVHHRVNFCNAFWNGTQMAYGDGNAADGCGPLARSTDVTAHELTHAVTERESNLIYEAESGGMNEAMSDIFATFIESWVDGGKTGALPIDAGTFLVGEDVLSPFLRNMCDPAADGVSLDAWATNAGTFDVHFSSGIANLAFCLMTKGGTHPRGKTTFTVPAIGMDKAIRIFYEANVNILTRSSGFAASRIATEQAATNLGFDQATKDAVGCAWAAVRVGNPTAACGGGGGGGGDTVLQNGVAVTGLSDARGGQKFFRLDVPANQATVTFQLSGGTGDADMHVSFGARPTLQSFQCRPFLNGNNETCTFTPPQAGSYFIMLNGFSAYSGASLRGTFTAATGDPQLTNGVPVTNLSGTAGNQKFFRINTPAGRRLVVQISGGTGDADLYTRFGSRPTTTTFACRPFLGGNNETCTTTSTQAGDTFIMVRAFATYGGVTLIASF